MTLEKMFAKYGSLILFNGAEDTIGMRYLAFSKNAESAFVQQYVISNPKIDLTSKQVFFASELLTALKNQHNITILLENPNKESGYDSNVLSYNEVAKYEDTLSALHTLLTESDFVDCYEKVKNNEFFYVKNQDALKMATYKVVENDSSFTACPVYLFYDSVKAIVEGNEIIYKATLETLLGKYQNVIFFVEPGSTYSLDIEYNQISDLGSVNIGTETTVTEGIVEPVIEGEPIIEEETIDVSKLIEEETASVDFNNIIDEESIIDESDIEMPFSDDMISDFINDTVQDEVSLEDIEEPVVKEVVIEEPPVTKESTNNNLSNPKENTTLLDELINQKEKNQFDITVLQKLGLLDKYDVSRLNDNQYFYDTLIDISGIRNILRNDISLKKDNLGNYREVDLKQWKERVLSKIIAKTGLNDCNMLLKYAILGMICTKPYIDYSIVHFYLYEDKQLWLDQYCREYEITIAKDLAMEFGMQLNHIVPEQYEYIYGYCAADFMENQKYTILEAYELLGKLKKDPEKTLSELE